MTARTQRSPKAKNGKELPPGAEHEPAAASPAAAEDESPREPRQDRGQRRVEEILDAAAAVVLEVGWEAATTQAIAERAGASVGSLFHFFPTRDAILVGLGRRCARAMFEANERAMPPEVVFMEPHLLFDRVVKAQAELAQSSPVFSRIHEALKRRFGPNAGPICELDEALYERVRGFCGVRLPRLTPEQREASARLMVGVVSLAMEQAAQLPQPVARELFSSVTEMLAGHLAAADARYGPVDPA